MHAAQMTATDRIDVYGLRADGRQVQVRAVVPADADALAALSDGVCEHSIYLRFFSTNRQSAREYYRALRDDPDLGRHALVACDRGEIVAVACAEPLSSAPDASAELGLLVADRYQGQGIGTLLLEHLMSRARHAQVSSFVANVMVENHRMLSLLHDLGYRTERALDGAGVCLTWSLHPNEAAQHAVDRREGIADVHSLRPLLEPRSVAVIGASARPRSVGGGLLHGLVVGNFAGSIYPINPHHAEVEGLRCYPSLADLPEAPDLAIVAVPANEVLAMVRRCGERGVKGLVIVSSGFREVSAEGRDREREVVACAHRYGMRLIGPNCLGVLNADPTIRLSATFADLTVRPGGLGLASQSGALGIAVVASACERGLGISQFVSLGNKADVSGNDLLRWWADNDATTVIGLYLESFGNPRKFLRIAREVSRSKPILALKSGRSDAGQRAGTSHTAAAAAPDSLVDALCAQAGVVRVATIEQLIDTARVLDSQPVPNGPRVAIIGNSGGPQILAADAAVGAGLSVTVLSEPTMRAIRESTPSAANAGNPVDLGGAMDSRALRAAVTTIASSGEVDTILLVIAPTAAITVEELADIGCQVAIPIVAVVLGERPGSVGGGRLATFEYPEAAAAALGFAWEYARLRTEPVGIVAEALEYARLQPDAGNPNGWLGEGAVAELLQQVGIETSPYALVRTAEQARSAAGVLGYPVAMKCTGVVHKTEVSGVRLDRRTPGEVDEAFEDLSFHSVEVQIQPMAPAGTELIVGALVDPTFGPVVMLGVGGVTADIMPGRSFRLIPVSNLDAKAMVAALPKKVLAGFRGATPVCATAVARLVEQVSALISAHPEIAELDLNPVIATGARLVVVDAKVRIAESAPHGDPLVPQFN